MNTEVQNQMLDLFGRHLLAFTWYEGQPNDEGIYRDAPTFSACSGFVLEIYGKYWLVTAGHSFVQQSERAEKHGFVATDQQLRDFWGSDDSPRHPIPFQFFDESVVKIVEYKPDEGLDYALINIPPLIMQCLSKTIVPFPAEHWRHQEEYDFEHYLLVGLPLEHKEEQSGRDADGTLWSRAALAEFLLPVERITSAEGKVDDTTLPQFVGRVGHKSKVENISGMSGGPILGIHKHSDGTLRYVPVAIQSRWKPRSRIIMGTLVPVLGYLTEAIFERIQSEQDSGT